MINEKYETLYTFKACEPMVKPLDNIASDNILFVGDSARLVDPASGAGIHNAVISGTLAGITAAKYILGEINSLDLYQRLMKSKIKKISKTYRSKCKLNTSEKYNKTFSVSSGSKNLIGARWRAGAFLFASYSEKIS